MVVASHHDSRRLVATVAVAVAGLAVLATLIFGGSLGFRREWGYLLVGTGMIGLVIFFAFEASVPANTPGGPGVGLGALFVTVALLPVISLLLWLGGATGLVARHLSVRAEP
jgi:hypothetical protein